MQGEGGGHENASLKDLLEKKAKLLKEKEQLIKERNDIIREQQLPLREVAPSEKKDFETSKKPTESIDKSALSGIFGSTASPSSKPVVADGRRSFLRNLALGITLTISSIGLLLLLSAPSIERAAYFQLCLLYEQGSIFFTNKLRQAWPRSSALKRAG